MTQWVCFEFESLGSNCQLFTGVASSMGVQDEPVRGFLVLLLAG